MTNTKTKGPVRHAVNGFDLMRETWGVRRDLMEPLSKPGTRVHVPMQPAHPGLRIRTSQSYKEL
ncbi:MAG: hypothetical protein KGH94_04415 [Candidatus Micrarchaeota archaeon]|nr:hypothetical protein [Candidatus Micrarchaeota archaeon]